MDTLPAQFQSDAAEFGSQHEIQNQILIKKFHAFLEKEQFDGAIKTITSIRGDRSLRRKTITEYLIELGRYLEHLKPDLILPSGWLRDESLDFADTFKTAVALLGDDFTASLVQLCGAPDFSHDRYLLHVFLEISLDGYLWTDIVKLCLSVAAKDQKSKNPARFTMMLEKLCNVRHVIVQSPKSSMPNPFFDGVEEDDVLSGPRQREGQMLFNPGSPVITLADIDREIAIAAAGAGICSAGCDTATIPDRKGESLAHRFFRKAMELRLYREAVLLAKFCGVADSGAVFKEMADWVILVSTLSIEHWDNFFKEIAGFLERLKIPEAEKLYEKGQESAELYIERTVENIEGALVDLYLEFGSPADLKTIMTCYVQAQRLAFPRLNRIVVDPRNFSEILWHLLGLEGQHSLISYYITDWVNGLSGRDCVATAPVFSLLHSDDRIELASISHNLYCALKNYFAAGNSDVQMTWSNLDSAITEANADGVHLRLNDRLVVAYSEPADFSESGSSDRDMDSEDDRQSN